MKTISQRAARAMQQHLQQLINMSNADHKDFTDSCADVVEHLWLLPKAVHHLVKTEGAE